MCYKWFLMFAFYRSALPKQHRVFAMLITMANFDAERTFHYANRYPHPPVLVVSPLFLLLYPLNPNERPYSMCPILCATVRMGREDRTLSNCSCRPRRHRPLLAMPNDPCWSAARDSQLGIKFVSHTATETRRRPSSRLSEHVLSKHLPTPAPFLLACLLASGVIKRGGHTGREPSLRSETECNENNKSATL